MTATAERSWWSQAILVGGVIAVTLLLIGPLGTRLGIWPYTVGIPVVLLAAVLATIGTLAGVVALIATLVRRAPANRPAVGIGVALAALVLAVVGMQMLGAAGLPAIHDIKTDVDDPPRFEAVVALRGPGDHGVDYDAEALPEQQRAAYPEVTTLVAAVPPGELYNRTRRVLEEMNLEVVAADASTGVIEATAKSFWFGFTDDVVVRIRAGSQGSVLDVRSASRVGVSDLGANARRIGEILDRLSAPAGP